MTNEIRNCIQCKYYLPTGDTFYNKPCGYCGNFRIQRRRISDDKACGFFERSEKAPKREPP